MLTLTRRYGTENKNAKRLLFKLARRKVRTAGCRPFDSMEGGSCSRSRPWTLVLW